MTPRVALLGGGGHAAVVIEAMQASGYAPAFILDRDEACVGGTVLDVPVLGSDDHLRNSDATHFLVTLGAIGRGTARERLFDVGTSAGLQALSIVHPTAVVSTSAKIGAGTVVLAGAVICARAEIGRNVIVNTRAVVEHDCRVGDHVHVASAACLCGGVRVGDRSLIGAGAIVRQGITIGADVLVALGSAVIADAAARATIMGVPARARP